MKQRAIIIGILSLIGSIVQAHEYVSTSVLASGNIVKIQVPSTGVYRLSYEQIAALGIKPEQVRLLGYGGNLINQDFRQTREDDVPSTPFYMNKGNDGVFSEGDYILFYAKGPVDWRWNNSTYARTRNYYANYGCYFLSDNVGEQLLIAMTDTLAGNPLYEISTHTALQLHEEEEMNLVDLGGTEGGGREWYGNMMTAGTSLRIPFTFPDAVNQQPMLCRINAAGSSSIITKLFVRVASATDSCQFSRLTSTTDKATTKSRDIKTKVTGSDLPVVLQYSASLSTSKAYINYIEMQVTSRIQLRDDYLIIRNTDNLKSPALSRYHLLGADAYTQVWNITTPTQTYQCNTTWQGDTLCWLSGSMTPQVFLAIRTNASFPTPASRGKVYNQNIHQQLRGVQHVIVTPEYLRSAAEQLKQAHEQINKNERWWVVSDEEVYNEFSSGTPDASAIRWMMKYLWDNFKNTSQAPRTVLLFGDGSFDNRQLLKTSGTPVLLTYQAENSVSEPLAYATDDYFGWLEDNDGMSGTKWQDYLATMEIGVGRLPVTTYEQAEQVVNKISTYLKNANSGSWKQQLCFLADDGDNGSSYDGGQHVRSVEMATNAVAQIAPEYIINKIYLDSYDQETTATGGRYPTAQATYNNMLQSGVLLMDYAGHGSSNNICSELFLTRQIVENMTNTNLGVWALATCSFSHFDKRDLSTAEVAILNPNGGAIGVISSARTAYVTQNEQLNKYVCANIVTHNSDGTYPYNLGEVLSLAKNSMGRDNNKLCYLLLGDPSVKLNYPSPYQVLITNMPDTLRALDLVTISGYIANEAKDTVPFNGELTIKVYDKQQVLCTRGNDQPIVEAKDTVHYLDYPYLLFVGQCEVKDGMFTTQFRMPKDLRYNIDYARLTLFATGDDATGHAEALGHSEAFKVGGSSSFRIEDNEGPEMELYLNSFFFRDGDEVNSTPHFYANLRDENGINTAGSGIGHDLMLTIDNDAKQAYVMNSYYTSSKGSYQEGLVSYPMTTLADGQHSLSFRACDMLNNATTKYLGFTVNSSMSPEVKRLLVYPNPVSRSGELNMQLQYDRPDDLITITLSFYDLMGHTVWSTTRQTYGYNGTASLTVSMNEMSLPSGVYLYQLRIENSTQRSVPHSGKIIVY